MPSAAPSQLPPIPPNIGDILGSQLAGTLVSFMLYGVLAIQVYFYQISFPKDNPLIRSLVYFTALLETTVTIMNGIDAFRWYADGFGNMLVIASPGKSPVYTPILGSVMAFVVQMFFCYRIWVIKRQAWWLSCFIAAIALVGLIGGFVGGVEALVIDNISEGRSSEAAFVWMWLIGGALTDVIIAVVMVYLLLQAGNMSHRRSANIVIRLVRMTVETNTLTASMALLGIILFAGIPNTTYFIGPTIILGKLYSNTLLLTFNNRAFMQGKQGLSAFSQLSSVNSGGYLSTIPLSQGLSFNDQEVTLRSMNHVQITSQSITRADPIPSSDKKLNSIGKSEWHV